MSSIDMSSWWIFKAGGIVTAADSATWRVWNPGPTDTIAWDSGSNNVDGTVIPVRPTLTETKFNVAPAGGPAAKVLAGMSYRDVGAAAGTVVVTSGTGSSKAVPGMIGGTNWECKWKIGLNVTPGAPGAAVSYDVSASASDPITMPVGTFDDNTNNRTSLYLPVVVSDLGYGDGGAGGFSVKYKTGDGTIQLFDLHSSAGAGMSVTGDEPDFLRIYVLDNPLENPMASGKLSYSLSDLKDIMSAKMLNNQQHESLQLGFLLENIPVPTTEVSSGILAEMHIGSRLSEFASSYPEEKQKTRK
ncbi:MAG: hypothetical protein IT559_00280 [Alphaproteobacteria bacterium]|nr:hypothetical protein [Alphaproteobacteria bacterium]